MRVLALDYDPLYGDDEDTRDSFDSDVSVFDYDVVFWDPERSRKNYDTTYNNYQGLPRVTDSDSARMLADATRRNAEFIEYLHSGRTLIVIARAPQECYIATGEIRTSGTGRNASQTVVVRKFDLNSAIPGNVSFLQGSGDRVEAIGDGPIPAFLRKHRQDLRYAATMSAAPGTVVAQVKNTERAVGSILRTQGGGQLIILPDTRFEAKYNASKDEFAWPTEASYYFHDLIGALEDADLGGELSRPSWSNRFRTDRQSELRMKIRRQEDSVARARTKLLELKSDSDNEDLRDQLYLGSGRLLELRVKEVLEMLGGTVSEPEPNRDDWKVVFEGGRRAVVEVKGVTKSAAEKHAAQLEKWVANSLVELGEPSKGILVVNTWRETPLDDRKQDDFPPQMIPYSTSREHVLVTGLELFSVAAEVSVNPERAEHWREQLLSTSGRLTDVPDWRDFIKEVKTGES